MIMASDPPDAADLCQPLMKELLTVSNAYSIEVRNLLMVGILLLHMFYSKLPVPVLHNSAGITTVMGSPLRMLSLILTLVSDHCAAFLFVLQNFDALRGAAVQSVLLRNPHIAVPFLTASLLGNDLPLGLKLLVLEWLMEAARALSNIPEDAATAVLEQGGSTTEKSKARVGKTVVKRPGKLAQLNTRTKYFRNNFGPLAPLFFYPLIQLLGRIWHDKLNEEWAPTAAADQFNLISELFEPKDAEGIGGDAKTSAVATKDLTLKHLDGVAALLPSQCLVALGLFTRCTVNTTSQRYVATMRLYRNPHPCLYWLLCFELVQGPCVGGGESGVRIPPGRSRGTAPRLSLLPAPVDGGLHHRQLLRCCVRGWGGSRGPWRVSYVCRAPGSTAHPVPGESARRTGRPP